MSVEGDGAHHKLREVQKAALYEQLAEVRKRRDAWYATQPNRSTMTPKERSEVDAMAASLFGPDLDAIQKRLDAIERSEQRQGWFAVAMLVLCAVVAIWAACNASHF